MSQPPKSLGRGTRIGAYEIVAPIGHGGMGQVYRALDSRLKREVAVKVLPASFKADVERLARFQREAELLASLNHPNIAHVYGLEHAEGEHALVMELAAGVTLAERTAAGPLPIEDAVAIARQVLDALEGAHDRGIVHRDLKPANIMIGPDGSVKVLDFGLAKAIGMDAMGGEAGESGRLSGATVTSPAMTAAGMLLGTAAYMAPEQARGRAVDRRADLWAFGCVLYEMLTGARAFGGDDVTETLANVLKSDVRVETIPANVPARVRQVIIACLQREVRQRLASAQDARLLLDGAFQPQGFADVAAPARLRPAWRRTLPYAVGALAATLVVGLLAWRLAPAAARPVSRFTISLPEGQEFRNTGRHVVAVAPDGSAFVYNAADGLRLRWINELVSRVIPGTESPLANPVFSPDSRHVVFYSTDDNQVKRLSLAGGAPTVLARNTDNPYGIDWSQNETILLALRQGIARIPATGGTPEVIVKRRENETLTMPQLLPASDAVLFTLVTATTGEEYQMQVVAESLRTGQRTNLLDGARDARFLPTGHLVYAVDENLFAVAFDPVTLTTSGAPIELVQGVWWRRSAAVAANWSVSNNGTLIYAPNVPDEPLRPMWVSREGATAHADHLPPAKAPRLSPDGKQLLVEIDNDIWIYEVETGRRKRLTNDQSSGRPAWHPSATRIAYTSSRNGGPEIWVANADGTGTPRQLTELPGVAHVDSWSRDGKTLAFHYHPPGAAPNEILVISPDDPTPKPAPLVQGKFPAEDAVFSPDGRYVAYLSAETGGREIYVRAFPGPGPQVPVSVGGGREPVWGRTGEIFYRSLTGDRMMAVNVTTTPALTIGPPRRLFDGNYFIESATGSPRPQYDVTADGRRFVMLQVDRASAAEIVVVQNWFEELRRAIATR